MIGGGRTGRWVDNSRRFVAGNEVVIHKIKAQNKPTSRHSGAGELIGRRKQLPNRHSLYYYNGDNRAI